jgi:hypothetical protein
MLCREHEKYWASELKRRNLKTGKIEKRRKYVKRVHY